MEDNRNNLNIVIYGAGAVGASICGWLFPHYNKIYLLARGENAQAMKSNGLIMYQNTLDNKQVISVNVIEDLNEKPNADVVIIAVKNYDLEDVANDIYSKLGDTPIIIALQNGVENQNILPKYFSKVIYGVIMIGAWIDKPGIFGHSVKGYVIFGTLDNSLQTEMKSIKKLLSPGFKFRISQNIQDAIHTKLIFNLSNPLLTLIKHANLDETAISKLGKIYNETLVEGIMILEAANFKEHRIPGLVPWSVLKNAQDSEETSGTMILNRLNASGPNSMSQDIIIRQKTQSELEYLVGYIVNLAQSLGILVPYNSTIYELCKSQFQKKPYKQLEVEDVWQIIQQKLN